jgi:hypothetical protein
MAVSNSVSWIAANLARAVVAYAESHGLSPGEFALAGALDTTTDRISLAFGTDRPIDQKAFFSGLMTAIRDAFPASPGLLMHLGLVIRRVSNLDQFYSTFRVADNEVDITDLFERPRV